MTMLVTGGAGFVGSNLIAGLNRAGEDHVIVVDSLLHAEKHLNLNGLRVADYLDKSALFEVLPKLGKLRGIFHQGACTSTTERDGRYMMENNYAYSKRLLHYALDHRVPFVYASSAAVYGNGERGFEETEACEWPLNVYAYSKLQFDNYVRRLFGAAESAVAGIRYFNVYGPREGHKGRMASVAYQLYGQHRRGEPMRIFQGSEQFRRDFVYVEDVVRVNLFLFERRVSGIFNCGTGQARSFADVGQKMLELCPGARLEEMPFPAELAGKYQRFTEARLGRLRGQGYERDFTSLEEGLSRYVAALGSGGADA
jgi:ADP-L-glycero-D-manno-heptose 6-epimerase